MNRLSRNLVISLSVTLIATAVVGCALKPDNADYMAIFLDGKKAGYLASERVVKGDVVVTTQIVSIAFRREGSVIESLVKMTARETLDGKPLSFRAENIAQGRSQVTIGTITPEGKITLSIMSAGQTRSETMDWPEGAIMIEGARLLGLKHGLREGTTYAFDYFNPADQTVISTKRRIGKKCKVDIMGRIMELVAMEEAATVAGIPMASTYYIDESQDMHKQTTTIMGISMVMISCPKSAALRANDALDIASHNKLSSPRPLNWVERLSPLRFTVTPGKAGDQLQFPSGGEQQAEPHRNIPGAKIITVRRMGTPRDVAFPYTGQDAEALKALKANSYVQSDHAKIIAMARKAVGGAKDAASAAKKIRDYVSTYIHEKNLKTSYATALDVLRTRSGDCTEHAILAMALCQAVGIPARMVTGVTYVPEGNYFGGHAWYQIYLKGSWHSFDPTMPFDMSHIAMSYGNGDSSACMIMVDLLSKATITKIEVIK
jgi:Transglutaminase-like superfamily